MGGGGTLQVVTSYLRLRKHGYDDVIVAAQIVFVV